MGYTVHVCNIVGKVCLCKDGEGAGYYIYQVTTALVGEALACWRQSIWSRICWRRGTWGYGSALLQSLLLGALQVVSNFESGG